jgi:hypothetical protein
MPVSRLQGTLAPLIAALAVAACGSVEEALIEQGRPPAYAKGYADGCTSGKEAAGGLFAEARKDASRYGAGAEYTQGWNDGFASCKSREEAMVRDARLRSPSRDK